VPGGADKAALPGQGNLWEESRARRIDIGMSAGQVGLGLGDIGAAQQKFGRQACAHHRRKNLFQIGIGDIETFRWATQQHGERIERLLLRRLQRRQLCLRQFQLRLFARKVEMRGGTGLHAQLDHFQDGVDGVDVLVLDGNAAADRQHIQILAGDIGGDGQRHGFLREACGLELLSGGAQ
jgi:hypothetical protein